MLAGRPTTGETSGAAYASVLVATVAATSPAAGSIRGRWLRSGRPRWRLGRGLRRRRRGRRRRQGLASARCDLLGGRVAGSTGRRERRVGLACELRVHERLPDRGGGLA